MTAEAAHKIGIMEKKMETIIISWGYIRAILGHIGIMEKNMETTIMVLYWGY